MSKIAEYPFQKIEQKWQKKWKETKLYKTDLTKAENKLYCLVMFIYPSGDKLHIGHWYNYAPTDTWARFKRMQGYNVFEPMGYDAFGLPAENYAIKKGVHPAESTAENIRVIRQQLERIGAMYDWDKEVDTSAPQYYKWTQWFFLQFYKNGLAYRSEAPVNWCPQCKTVLANEQVIVGKCERCDAEVIKKDLKQWFFRITNYADRLLEGHDRIDWPQKTITMQKEWIKRREGSEIQFGIEGSDEHFSVFTTRPDTLFGVTYMVLAPEHRLVEKLTSPDRRSQVEKYVKWASTQTEIERTSTEKEKTGVFIGAYAINPINNEKIPIWIADYALITYGTGAVMAVPAHDERDFEFATKFELPIRKVIDPFDSTLEEPLKKAYVDPGKMVNSGQFSGLDNTDGGKKVTKFLNEKNLGGFKVNYKLRDWLISRQRYWGAPIPIVYCEKCGEVPVPEEDLPIKLPEKVEFIGNDESPLSTSDEFVNTTCPKCGGPAKREVDTMDTFMCSSWYYLRYLTPDLADKAFDDDLVKKWLPVDQYVGGSEHANMHLMYARFFAMALYDMGLIPFEEPFKRLVHQGIITNHGAKMSKSHGNVVNPEKFVDQYGSDTFRMFMMFMGSYSDGGDWSDEGIAGIYRFVNRIWRLIHNLQEKKPVGSETEKSKEIKRIQHYTVKSVTRDLQEFHFNTAISRLMEFVNAMYIYIQELSVEEQNKDVLEKAIKTLILCLAPIAPHIAEELWKIIGEDYSIFNAKWPEYDENIAAKDIITIVFQINGKLRSKAEVDADIDDDEIKKLAFNDEKIKSYVKGKKIIKTIVVRKKLVNIVVN